jgi:DeoR family fructose operon transcriptional repressor
VAQGSATRTYGGAAPCARPIELTLAQKEQAGRDRKDAIAAHAASLVSAGDVLILDAGTTTGRLALHLRERAGLTVLTNGVNTLLTLREREGIELIALGGRLRHTSQAFLGPLATWWRTRCSSAPTASSPAGGFPAPPWSRPR